MPLSNTDDRYGGIARGFHWLTAILIFGMIPAGLYMVDMAYSPEKLQIYGLHKSVGLLIMILACARIVWRFFSLPPEAMDTHATWECFLAKGVHAFLYLAMIGMPVTGWLMSSAGEFPVTFFGLPVPALTGRNPDLYLAMRTAHGVFAFTLIGAIGLHAAGALKHHLIDRDSTLVRMAGRQARWAVLVIIPVLTLFFAGVGWLTLTGEHPPEDAAPVVAEAEEEKTPLAPHEWRIVKGQSEIAFEAVMNGESFTGTFGEFGGTIVFDPENLQNAKATITIGMNSAKTGSPERDTQIAGAEWFYAESFPDAQFDTIAFERGAENSYVAIGNLTLRGVTLPVTLPFTLSIADEAGGRRVASMKGMATLDRTSFGIGQGQWADPKAVAHTVRVAVSVTAEQP